MPISKTYLPDVNVWVAVVYDGHVHHKTARLWMNEAQETVAFCRITQMGLLRLITNPKVMGKSALTPTQAWQHYDQLHQDPRITFLNEPSGIESYWRSMNSQKNSHHSWTDAYLLAFAKARDLTFVTFDQGFKHVSALPVIIL